MTILHVPFYFCEMYFSIFLGGGGGAHSIYIFVPLTIFSFLDVNIF